MKTFKVTAYIWTEKVFEKIVQFPTQKDADNYSLGVRDAIEGVTGITCIKYDRYTTDGKNSVYAGKTEIARAYVDGEVRVLQEVPREKVWEKIITDCPDFAKYNNMDPNYRPKIL